MQNWSHVDSTQPTPPQMIMKDFFISYNQADKETASK
jgi:hypothetical protein